MTTPIEIQVAVLSERVDNTARALTVSREEQAKALVEIRADHAIAIKDVRDELKSLDGKIENTHAKLDDILKKISNVQFGWKVIVAIGVSLAAASSVIGQLTVHFGLFK